MSYSSYYVNGYGHMIDDLLISGFSYQDSQVIQPNKCGNKHCTDKDQMVTRLKICLSPLCLECAVHSAPTFIVCNNFKIVVL